MKTIYIILFIFFTSSKVQAQFSDTIRHHLGGGISGNINKSNGTTYLFNNNLEYKYRKEQSEFNLNANWIYGENSEKKTNNDFKSSVDFNLYDKSVNRLNYWGLGSFNTSFSLKINSQWQAGLGAAYKLMDRDYLYFRVSNGVIFEHSKVIVEDMDTDYNTFRNSLRLQIRSFLGKSIKVEGTGFWQPSLEYRNDYILSGNATLTIKLNKFINFNTQLIYNNISKTKKENLLFTYGITLEQYF